jgi:DNA-binding CsgD family transcriptional regulator
MTAAQLLERDAELEQVTGVLAAVRAGCGGAMVFVGPPGIGKSARIDAASGAGFQVGRARGGPTKRERPLAAIRQLLGPLLQRAGDDVADGGAMIAPAPGKCWCGQWMAPGPAGVRFSGSGSCGTRCGRRKTARSRSFGPDALTPTELRVAGLAAAGNTNKQIAQAMFLTVKPLSTTCGRRTKVGYHRPADLGEAPTYRGRDQGSAKAPVADL